MSKERLMKAIDNATVISKLEQLRDTGLDKLIARKDIDVSDKAELTNLINDKITELGPLYKRMDETRDRVYNKPYELVGFDGKKIAIVSAGATLAIVGGVGPVLSALPPW